MKKHILFISAIIAISLITTVNALRPIEHKSDKGNKTTPLYTISDYNGRLAIFEYNSEIPIEIYDIYIDTLPDLDYRKLQEGVNIYTDDSLYIMIEEYTS